MRSIDPIRDAGVALATAEVAGRVALMVSLHL
jgi:hypothetical protein